MSARDFYADEYLQPYREFANHTQSNVMANLMRPSLSAFHGELKKGRTIDEVVMMVAKAFKNRLPRYQNASSPVIKVQVYQKIINGKNIVGVHINSNNYHEHDSEVLDAIWHGQPAGVRRAMPGRQLLDEPSQKEKQSKRNPPSPQSPPQKSNTQRNAKEDKKRRFDKRA
ncbi:MAG: hypothetical protein Q8P02_02170 [Candidatus Micrarchaeota archaeon]|nr:hypothetical protein [Candidatus Micrarchaeota archaeon]